MPAWTPVMRGDMVSLVMGGAYYIRNGDGAEELYRLEDRGQIRDLAESDPTLLARLRAAVDSLRSGRNER